MDEPDPSEAPPAMLPLGAQPRHPDGELPHLDLSNIQSATREEADDVQFGPSPPLANNVHDVVVGGLEKVEDVAAPPHVATTDPIQQGSTADMEEEEAALMLFSFSQAKLQAPTKAHHTASHKDLFNLQEVRHQTANTPSVHFARLAKALVK